MIQMTEYERILRRELSTVPNWRDKMHLETLLEFNRGCLEHAEEKAWQWDGQNPRYNEEVELYRERCAIIKNLMRSID